MGFITYVKGKLYDHNSEKTRKEEWKYTVVSFLYYIWSGILLFKDGLW